MFKLKCDLFLCLLLEIDTESWMLVDGIGLLSFKGVEEWELLVKENLFSNNGFSRREKNYPIKNILLGCWVCKINAVDKGKIIFALHQMWQKSSFKNIH